MGKGQRGGAVREGSLVMDNTRGCPCGGCHSRVERQWGQRAAGGSVGSPNTHPHSWPQTPLGLPCLLSPQHRTGQK